MTQPDISDHWRAMRSQKNRAVFGCLGFSLAAGIAALMAAVHLMNHWDSISGALRVVAIALAMIGTVLLVPSVLVIAAFIPRIFGNKTESKKRSTSSAGRTVERIKQLYVDRHEYRPATDDDFTNRDRSWYEATTRELQALGYRCLGDRVNLTVQRTSGVLAILRRFISADLTTMTSVYQYVRRNKATGAVTDLRIYDFESELVDGSFIATSNSAPANLATLPPQIHSAKYPTETSSAELHRLHVEAKSKVILEQPHTAFITIRSMEDYEAAQQRQQAVKAAFRKGIGYVDPAEVRRIAERRFPNNPAEVERMVARFDAACEPSSNPPVPPKA